MRWSRSAMADFRLRLTLTSPLATPPHSGTLFGHLCWIKRYRDGEQALGDWLAEQVEQPLLLSDALPADHLPRPLLGPMGRPEQRADESRTEFIGRLQQGKNQRKHGWLTLADFITLRDGLNEARLVPQLTHPPGSVRQVRQAHNTINRLTGTTPASGGLYFMPDDWYDDQAAALDVYVRSTLNAATLGDWFSQVGEFGFGRDANLGRGCFRVTVEPADPRLFDYNGNRLLSLSHGTLTGNMAGCRYKLHTHYGKLGGLYAGGSRSPFKYPLTLTQPGLTFSPADDGPYGELLQAVHPHHPQVCQHAFHLCLPYTETAAEGS